MMESTTGTPAGICWKRKANKTKQNKTKQNKTKQNKTKDKKRKERKDKTRQDNAFWRQFNEEPSIIPGSQGGICYPAYIPLCPGLFELIKLKLQALSCLFCCGNLKRGDANRKYV